MVKVDRLRLNVEGGMLEPGMLLEMRMKSFLGEKSEHGYTYRL